MKRRRLRSTRTAPHPSTTSQPSRVHVLWREQPGLYRGFLVDVATALVMGAVLVIGGRQHTQATAWDVVNANGGPVVWGLALVGLGAALAVTSTVSGRLVVGLMWVLALFYLVLGIAFGLAVFADPEQGASYVGSVFAARASFMHMSRANCYLGEAPRVWTG